MNIEELMGGTAAAKYLGVSRSLVYRFHAQGRLVGQTIGGHLFFSREELDRFKTQPRPTGKNINHPKSSAGMIGPTLPV